MSNRRVLTIDDYNEKQSIKLIVGDVVAACLYYPQVTEAHGETARFDVRAWREESVVKVEIKYRQEHRSLHKSTE